MPSTQPQGRYAPGYGAAQKPMPMDQGGASRYTPQLSTGLSLVEGSLSTMTSPTEVTRSLGVPSLDQSQQRPLSAPRSVTSRYAPSPQGLGLQGGLGVPRPEASRASSDYGVPYGSAAASRRGSAQTVGSTGSYEPTPSLAQEPSPFGYQPSPLQQPQMQEEDEDVEDAFGPKVNGLNGLDAEDGGYEPPSTGYEAPSYQPYQPDPEPDSDEEVKPKPKRKGIMDLDDDDDDMVKRAAALKKAQADRAADEAFRKAAEADAEKDNKKPDIGHKKASGSWLGGWFKKDPTAELNKPIRAKLGEESSFYYDAELKKWVNKKGGSESATPAAATPPPPRGPPSRVMSGATGPPSGPPSRVASATGLGGSSRPPTSGSAAPPMMASGLGSGPPSRAATPASMHSGPPDSAGLMPPAPFGASINGDGSGPPSGPPSRPPTSMSTASSLDDLLAGPRKAGGTVKGKKKGRYVDVMAK